MGWLLEHALRRFALQDERGPFNPTAWRDCVRKWIALCTALVQQVRPSPLSTLDKRRAPCMLLAVGHGVSRPSAIRASALMLIALTHAAIGAESPHQQLLDEYCAARCHNDERWERATCRSPHFRPPMS
jgi:hypothetical protein